MLDKLCTILLGKLLHIVGDRLTSYVFTEVIIINLGIHFYEVNDTLECVFRTDGELNRHGVTFETLVYHVKNMVKVRTHDIHLIDVNHTRNMIFVSLTPNGFRLRLNTALCAQNGNRTVKYTKRTLNFNSEINVAGSVDNIDTMVFPETSSCSGSDGYTSLLLLRHPVHGSVAVVGLTDFMVYTRVKQYTLCGSCFTGVDMRHYTNISCFFKSDLSWHNILHNRINTVT